MDLCIKTVKVILPLIIRLFVSILVLMDLCIKTIADHQSLSGKFRVSILVLMDLCIKTASGIAGSAERLCFNPCFNGSMYKNEVILQAPK